MKTLTAYVKIWAIQQIDRNSQKESKEILEIKNTLTEMKNAFDGLISRLDITRGKTSDLEDVSIKISKIETQREKKGQIWDIISNNFGGLHRHNTILERECRKKKLFEVIMDKSF
jgi:hypothetical protein